MVTGRRKLCGRGGGGGDEDAATVIAVEERGGRNPQDKSHLAFHDERFQCRKCARNASCFRVHKATQRIITIGKKKSLKKCNHPGKNQD